LLRLLDFVRTYPLGVRKARQFLDEGAVLFPVAVVVVQSGSDIARVPGVGHHAAVEESIFLSHEPAHPSRRFAGGPDSNPEEQAQRLWIAVMREVG